jgi:hypothetical protein
VGADEQNASRDARIEEIRGKIERGEEPSPEERDYMLSEGIEMPTEEGTAPPAM